MKALAKYFALLAVLLLASCTGVSGLAETMNDRNIRSCLRYTGGYGPFLHVSGVSATGGESMETCADVR